MAVDWGEIIGGVADIFNKPPQIYSPGFGGGSFPPATTTSTPRQVTVDTVTGEVKPCRRRRRRRLLTPTDLSDLAALAAVVGKGDALKMAVAKAVRR